MTEPTPDPATHPYPDAFTPAAARTGAQLVKPVTREEIELLLAPHTIDMRTWITGIMSDADFPESDTETMALGMLAQIIAAPNSEAALNAFSLDRAKEMCGNEPGGKSPVLEITGARALKSDYAEGAACYVIVQAIRLTDGERIQFTTGSRAVQTMIWKHMWEGWMPFRAMLEIRKERTRNGYYPINLVAGI